MSNYSLELNDATAATGTWRGVFFDGPQSDQNHDGDDHDARSAQLLLGDHLVAGLGSQIPVWFVYIGDDEAEPTDTVYKLHSFKAAEELARRMSRDRRLELIHEASPA
jgi:hypothetical protein